MMVGVMSYSFAISAMSSMISSLDHREEELNRSLDMLSKINLSYNMSTELFLQTATTITKKYKTSYSHNDKQQWLNSLPRKLRKSLSNMIHYHTILEIPSFNQQTKSFINYISSFLSIKKYSPDQIITLAGDEATKIYFILKGEVEYVLPEFNDTPYILIPEGQHFGELDVLLPEYYGKRYFTTKAKEDVEVLVLNKTDLTRIADKYEHEVRNIFRSVKDRHERIIKELNSVKLKLTNRSNKLNKLFETLCNGEGSRYEEVAYSQDEKNDSSFLEDSFTSRPSSAPRYIYIYIYIV